MKKFLPFLLLILVQTVYAGNTTGLLLRLATVNKEWNKQTDIAPVLLTADVNPQNFNQWIAAHLMLVEQTLRNRDVSKLSAAQRQNRLNLLNELNGYWQAGVFPVNDYLLYQNPVFIDRVGTHCAVGYLMQQSGNDALAQKINANEKFAYVHQIKTDGVKQWADKNGFTIDELAWIQPGYVPFVPCHDLDGGLNGAVKAIVADTVSQIVYVGGQFTASTSGATCSNIAAWISGFAGYDWIPVGNGLNGTVHTLLVKNNKLYAGGDFTMAGNVAARHVAVYDISNGQWQAIGAGLDSTVRSLVFYKGELYAGGNFTGFVSKWNGNTWQDITQGFLYGEGVRTLEVWDTTLVIGGSFELATGALRNHVATYNGTYMGWLGFGTPTAVNDFEIFNGTLFAGCDSTTSCGIAAFNGNDWQIQLRDTTASFFYFYGGSVKTLLKRDTSLLIGGNFSCSSGMYFGNSLMQYDAAGTYAVLTSLDSSVSALCYSGGNTYLGGDFVSGDHNGFPSTSYFNYIANLGYDMSGGTGIEETDKISMQLYPNPASDKFSLQAEEKIEWLELSDITGKQLLFERPGNKTKEISVSHLAAGTYVIKAGVNNRVSVQRFIKE